MRVTVFAPVTYLTLVILCMYNPAIHILLLEGRTQALLAMQTVPSYSLYRLHRSNIVGAMHLLSQYVMLLI